MEKQVKKISLNDTNNRYLVLDTETIHSGILEGQDNVKEVKDIIELSYKILNCDGVEIFGTRKGFIVKEFWEDEKYLLSSNFEKTKKGEIIKSQNFAINKIDYWKQQIEKGNLQVKSWGAILKQLSKDIKDYNVTIFSAYNARFDRQAIYNTGQLMSYRNYCKGLWELDVLDIMKIVEIYAKQKDFKKWADNHGAISQKGNYQCKAETLYRYLVNNSPELELSIPDSCLNWCESHIALEDIDCEAVILQSAISLSRRKREIKTLVNTYGNWSSFNKVIKSLGVKKVSTKKTSKQLQLDLQQ